MRDPVDVDRRLHALGAALDFFQAVRLIENAHPGRPRVGTSLRPRDDAVRFGQDPTLGFQPGAIAGYAPARTDTGARPRLAVNFLGLCGPDGPLPLHLTEYIRNRVRNHGDGTLVAFLDLFLHRMVALFYRAHASAEPAIGLDRPQEDRYADWVGSLFGAGTPAMRGRDSIDDFARLHFAGLMANRRRPAAGLATILRAYFGVPVEIEQFVGHWMRIPPDQQTRIGIDARGNQVGATCVLGKRVRDCQHRFRIVIGPVGYDDYQRLLPGGASLGRLADWVRSYAGITLAWDVRVVLARAAVPPLALGRRRLGWTSYLASGPPARDARECVINPTKER